MIVVSACLAIIGVLQITIGGDVLYGDKIIRAKTLEFEECKANNDYESPECLKFKDAHTLEVCMANYDLKSSECRKFTTWVESQIFEDCRANKDIESPQCQKYIGKFDLESEGT